VFVCSSRTSEVEVDSLLRFLTIAPGATPGAGQTWLSGLAHWTQRSGKAAHFVTAANAVFEFRYGVQLVNDDTAVNELIQLVNELAYGIW
jgi:hypothetical protein